MDKSIITASACFCTCEIFMAIMMHFFLLWWLHDSILWDLLIRKIYIFLGLNLFIALCFYFPWLKRSNKKKNGRNQMYCIGWANKKCQETDRRQLRLLRQFYLRWVPQKCGSRTSAGLGEEKLQARSYRKIGREVSARDGNQSAGRRMWSWYVNPRSNYYRVPKWWRHQKYFSAFSWYFSSYFSRAWWKTSTHHIWWESVHGGPRYGRMNT